jgi:beta-glucosidase
MVATGKPVIVLLFNGRPLPSITWTKRCRSSSSAGISARKPAAPWRMCCSAMYNPGGKLPISIPRSAGHLPVFYNHKPSARRGYLGDDVSPLYPFGFGISYTTFACTNLRLEKSRIKPGESTSVSVTVANTGKRTGTEVVQMYIRDCVSSVTRPVKELKGFQKVLLKPGEKKSISLEITPELLAFFDLKMKFTVEPGEFEIMVGNSSRDTDLQKQILTVTR